MPDDALNAIALETTLDSVVQCTGPSVAADVGETWPWLHTTMRRKLAADARSFNKSCVNPDTNLPL